MKTWHVLDINPEPWVVGPISVGRNGTTGKMFPRVGADQGLKAYQDAIAEALGSQMMRSGRVKLTFYFWRQQIEYQGPNKKVKKNYVDTTNMQKATEDALHGIFFENDLVVDNIHSICVEQGPDVTPKIIICVDDSHSPGIAAELLDIPYDVLNQLPVPQHSNVWRGPE